MSNKDAMKSEVTTAAQIRRAAVFGSVYLALICIPFAWFRGARIDMALASAPMCFVLALVPWIVYHVTSRQNNGLLFLGQGLLGASGFAGQHARTAVSIVGFTLFLLPVLCLIAWFAGVCSRASAARKQEAPACGSPLFDADLDRSTARARRS